MPTVIPGLLKFRAVGGIILVVLAVEAAIVAAVYRVELADVERDAKSVRSRGAPPSGPDWWKVEGPGISRPPTRKAEEVGLGDGEEVIGIVVDGQARAYRVGAFDDPSRHIVNDVVGDRPVTVAYCNLSDCARAYAGPRGGAPLDVSQAGMKDLEMIVKVGDAYYWHRTGEPVRAGGGPAFPYPSYPLARRKWGEWKREHPETDLYLGERRRPAS